MPNMNFSILGFCVLLTTAASALATMPKVPLYRETYRPQFHFTANHGWINDPNGTVYFDGEYHLFFQYRPHSLVPTPEMSWGHAVSTDLVHWTQLPTALSPDDHGFIWSGSAVVDWHNTSGFGTPDHPPLIAMYTAAKDPFSQWIAYSNDRGRTFTKYSGNPVINHIANDNRDPHAFWHEPTHRWVVAIFKDINDTFCLFSSPDLKHWTYLQDVVMPGCGECPDFFPLALDGDAAKTLWVFTAANGKYLVGPFDGTHFHPMQDVRQVDFGQNYYAVQTFNDIPESDGRRIQIAWMRDGKYPDMPFNQQMSFPAQLTLHQTPDGPRLFRTPVKEIELLRTGESHWHDVALSDGKDLNTNLQGELFEIHADIAVDQAEQVGLVIRNQPVSYLVKEKSLSGLGSAPLELDNGQLHLTILVDRTSMEVFANDGRVSLTSCFLPQPNDQGISAFAKGGSARLQNLTVYSLKSAW
jgi:sucrose-6-phosphate hydrolase SacC (GH32 family)